MPRQPTPWFRKGRGWYIQLGGKKHFLGLDKGEAQQRFHQLMLEKPTAPAAAPQNGVPAVVTVLDAYLDWLQNRVHDGSKAQRTFDWYHKYLQDFAKFQTSAGVIGKLGIDKLQPVHVYQWADSHPGWKTGKRGAMTAVQRAFTWAARAGLLKPIGGNSPVPFLEKPQQGRRELLVGDQEYRLALSFANDQEFRDLLELSWETGCRPHELFTVEALYVDLPTSRWVFPIRLSKGRKVQRVVYLSDRALEITRRLTVKHPAGPLLRNTEGKPWCVSSVKCRFQVLCRATGIVKVRQLGTMPPKIPRLTGEQKTDADARQRHEQRVLERRKAINKLARQHGLRLNLYAFRHSLITESLVRGLDAVTVSVLAGHRDTTMISRFYAHLGAKLDHMRQAANRARSASA